VWHFSKWETYEPGKPNTGLFTGYINAFLKTKQEASGWPAWAVTDEQKEDYLSAYKERSVIHVLFVTKQTV
jgi:hypothetical protein